MTVISGYSTTDYNLLPSGDPLTITSSGSIIVGGYGGAAINANTIADAVIYNAGNLKGGPQLFAGYGVTIGGGVLTNVGSIAGGTGYNAHTNSSNPGGVGGRGVGAHYFVQINNSGAIDGGAGGGSNFAYRGGGGGGPGLILFGGGQINNSGVIAGGNGGFGLAVDAPSGSGGIGVQMLASGSINNTGSILGGNAGNGAYGVGGDAVDLYGGGYISDARGALIRGGGGGYHGDGGDGVRISNGTLDVERGGTVEGGGSGSAPPSASPHDAVGVYLSGSMLITAGTIAGGMANSDSVYFAPHTDSSMFVARYAAFKGAIGGFAYGDSIDITNLSPSFVEGKFNAATDTINTGVDGVLQFGGDPTLVFSSDGTGGTMITVACFRRGTLIATEQGERPIESLEIGDRVLTKDRALKCIRWIGRRHYAGAELLGRYDVLPVLIQAGALAEQSPRRDLWVSPEHALYLNGALVPAGLLTNGVSIRTDESVHSVTYYHLEFDDQEVIFAEGAPAESFVDDESRRMFDNAGDFARRYPDAPHQAPMFCAPRVEDGAALEILREQLAARAGVAVGRAGITRCAGGALRT